MFHPIPLALVFSFSASFSLALSAEIDLGGMPRLADVSTVVDTGVGPAPIVDMGCYEVPGESPFIRGDSNIDAAFDIADPIQVLGILFGGGQLLTPACADAADANDDGTVDIADPVRMLATLFSGAPPLAPPFPLCGPDPTPDGLGCASGPNCP